MLSRETLLRTTLGIATVAIGLIEVRTLISAPLGLACLWSIGELLAPPPGKRDPVLRLLTIAGLVISVLVLTGVVLNFVPGGLTSRSWSIAIGSIAVVCALVVRRPATTITIESLRRFGASRVVAAVLIGGLVVLAFANSTRGANEAQAAPPLEMFTDSTPKGLDVVVRGGPARRDYVLRFDDGVTSSVDIAAGPGTPARVPVPAGTRRLRIDLVDPNNDQVLRTLILAPKLRQSARTTAVRIPDAGAPAT